MREAAAGVITIGRFRIFAVGVAGALLAPTGCGTESDRQGQVREAGAAVMPFDLGKTKHSSVKTDDGGVQAAASLGERTRRGWCTQNAI